MKTKEKFISIMSKVIIILATIIVFNFTKAFASSELKTIEKSAEYEKWENLSEEERESSIEPTYYGIDLKQSIKRSNYNTVLRSSGSILESSYNLKDYINIKNKNQYATGACWAFSFSSVLETSLAKKESKNEEYSPIHMEYTTAKMFNREFGNGGNSIIATAYCISGRGPVLEEEMPFDDYYDEINNYGINYYLPPLDEIEVPEVEVQTKINGTAIFPSINKKYENSNIKYYQSNGETEYTTDEVKAIRNLIKQHIKEDGAVAALMYSDIQVDQNGIYYTSYYNQENAAYFCNDSIKVGNHAVTIVGWDDNYSIDKFRTDCKPSSPGAYIVLNSYGTEFGENGYMYISYEDILIESSLVGITDLKEEIDYDKIYQYDDLGVNYAIGTGSETIYGGVKFSRDNAMEKIEYLNEIGIYLFDAEGIQIYLNKSSDDFSNSELVYSSESALEAGYHCIKLSHPMELTGEKFAITVKYTNKEGAYLPLECNLKDSKIIFTSNYFDKATSNLGQSFFSSDGTEWNEINGANIGFGKILNNTDTCIKAFTIFSDTPLTIPVTGVKLNNNEISLEVGDTTNLIVSFTPSNASNKNIKWESSNTSVATITKTGVITAISEGKTIIKAISEDGNKEAICELTVIKKTNTDDDIYKDNADTKKDNNENKDIPYEKEDNSVAKKKLPNTGIKATFIVILIGITLIVIIKLIKYRNLKDIK